jgi:hypothetical protein
MSKKMAMKKIISLFACKLMVAMVVAQNLGIGTVNPMSKLSVDSGGSSDTIARFSGGQNAANLLLTQGNSKVIFGTTPGAWQGGKAGTLTNDDFLLLTNGLSRLTVQRNTGNIGIGHYDPYVKLHVHAPQTNVSIARFESNGPGNSNILVTNFSIASELGMDIEKGYVGTASANDFAIHTGGLTRIFLKHTNGSVGINTNNPQKPLAVRADGNGDLLQFINHANNPVWHWWAPDNNLVLTETGVADHRLVIQKNSGNVGIGVPSPLYKLDLAGTARMSGLMVTGTSNIIQSSAPAAVTFYSSNFTNEGAPYENVTFYKDAEERIHLSGVVRISGTQNGAMFLLPPGARPTADLVFVAMTNTGEMTRVNVTPNGFVTLQFLTSGWVSVSGISFRAMQ